MKPARQQRTWRKKPQKPAWIHDHFDGSAHCIECNGECRLEGAERDVTDLVRFAFEYAALRGGDLGGMTRYKMTELGIDIDAMLAIAREHRSEPRIKTGQS